MKKLKKRETLKFRNRTPPKNLWKSSDLLLNGKNVLSAELKLENLPKCNLTLETQQILPRGWWSCMVWIHWKWGFGLFAGPHEAGHVICVAAGFGHQLPETAGLLLSLLLCTIKRKHFCFVSLSFIFFFSCFSSFYGLTWEKSPLINSRNLYFVLFSFPIRTHHSV